MILSLLYLIFSVAKAFLKLLFLVSARVLMEMHLNGPTPPTPSAWRCTKLVWHTLGGILNQMLICD